MKEHPTYCNYKITENGQVWSKRRKDSLGRNVGGRWLKPHVNIKTGYSQFTLYKNDKPIYTNAHTLVLETFVGLCPDGLECRHKDGNPHNNHLSNLTWGTHSENVQDAVKHKTHGGLYVNNRGELNGRSKLNTMQVRLIHKLAKQNYGTQQEIANLFNVGRRQISYIINRKQWKHI